MQADAIQCAEVLVVVVVEGVETEVHAFVAMVVDKTLP